MITQDIHDTMNGESSARNRALISSCTCINCGIKVIQLLYILVSNIICTSVLLRWIERALANDHFLPEINPARAVVSLGLFESRCSIDRTRSFMPLSSFSEGNYQNKATSTIAVTK
jgi:hypothetical protein